MILLHQVLLEALTEGGLILELEFENLDVHPQPYRKRVSIYKFLAMKFTSRMLDYY